MKNLKKFRSTVARKMTGKVSREDHAIRVSLHALGVIEKLSDLPVDDPYELEGIVDKINEEAIRAIRLLKKIQKETK